MHFFLVLFFSLVFISCVKEPEKFVNEDFSINTSDEVDAIEANKEDLLKVIDFQLGEPIKLDSPKRFIQVFILFTMNRHEEALKATRDTALTNDELLSAYLDESRKNFYKEIGISEDEYANYGNKNGEKIQDFLSENPEYLAAYEFIQGQSTEF